MLTKRSVNGAFSFNIFLSTSRCLEKKCENHTWKLSKTCPRNRSPEGWLSVCFYTDFLKVICFLYCLSVINNIWTLDISFSITNQYKILVALIQIIYFCLYRHIFRLVYTAIDCRNGQKWKSHLFSYYGYSY